MTKLEKLAEENTANKILEKAKKHVKSMKREKMNIIKRAVGLGFDLYQYGATGTVIVKNIRKRMARISSLRSKLKKTKNPAEKKKISTLIKKLKVTNTKAAKAMSMQQKVHKITVLMKKAIRVVSRAGRKVGGQVATKALSDLKTDHKRRVSKRMRGNAGRRARKCTVNLEKEEDNYANVER